MSTERKFPWFRVVGGCCSLIVVTIIVLVVFVAPKVISKAKGDPELSARVFFGTLRVDVPTAYALTAQVFRDNTTAEQLAASLVESPLLLSYTDITFTEIGDIQNDMTWRQGTISSDTETMGIYVELTHEADDLWHVNFFELGVLP